MKIFIAGPRAVSRLSPDVIMRLENIINNNFIILVGDANGVDKAVQNYCNEKGYQNIIVYASGNQIRNNVGKWKTQMIEVPKGIRGFDFYTMKDEQMAKDADYGLMIWNGKSKGTFNNIINLVNLNKTVLLYLNPTKEFYKINSMNDISLLVKCVDNQEINRYFYDKMRTVEQIKLMI